MWESSQSTALGLGGRDKDQWDQLINGLRWYRWNTIDKRQFYVFTIENPDQVPSVGVSPEDIADLANENYGDWHEAEWWAITSNFQQTAYFWKTELVEQPVVVNRPPNPYSNHRHHQPSPQHHNRVSTLDSDSRTPPSQATPPPNTGPKGQSPGPSG